MLDHTDSFPVADYSKTKIIFPANHEVNAKVMSPPTLNIFGHCFPRHKQAIADRPTARDVDIQLKPHHWEHSATMSQL